jgi:Fe-S cluster assembly protein SufD
MASILMESSPFASHFADLKPLLEVTGPAWLQSARERGFHEFETVGVPTTRDEEFKYLPLHQLTEWKMAPAHGATLDRQQVAKLTLGEIDAITLTFINGQFAPEVSTDDLLPDGVFVLPFEDAFLAMPETFEKWLGKVATTSQKLGTTNDDRFIALNTAFLQDGAFVYVPKNTKVVRPIHLQFVSDASVSPIAIHPRVLVVLEEHAEAVILESHVGQSGQYFTNPVTEVVLGAGAQLEHVRYQDETDVAVHIGNLAVHQSENSVFNSVVAQFGSAVARLDATVWVGGSNAETWLNGASVGRGEQRIDNHTRIDHAVPHCQSFEVYKTILDDHAHGVFNGKIFVYQDAQKTDAKQTNQGLLLSPTAELDTKPQLEIFADDVKCTHGATVGQLREDALFYLRARGIPKKEAEALLVYAFAAEVLEKISEPSIQAAIEARLFQKLA